VKRNYAENNNNLSFKCQVTFLFCSATYRIPSKWIVPCIYTARSVTVKDRSTTTNSRLLRVVIYPHYEASFCWCYSHC